MIVDTVEDLVASVPDGAKLAIPPSRSAPSMAITRALISRRIQGLHIVAVPTSGLQADMLIGAGFVSTVESAGITLDEFGQAPRFVAAVKRGGIHLKDTTCPALISGLQAGEKGIPFIPMRGLLGTDLLKHRADYQVIDNPMTPADDKIVLLPAIVPDFALIHAPVSDRSGNVWIGGSRELMTMAHASKNCLITVERVIDEDLMSDPLRAPATIPSLYVSNICIAERGAAPYGLAGEYEANIRELARYAQMAKSEGGFDAFMSEAPVSEAAE